jgi:hypothetical protein
VRREPAPGAQLSLFDQEHGLRYQANAGDTPIGQLAHLEARHRAYTRVRDRIGEAKDTGLGRFPSRTFAINAVWLELTLVAADLIAWTQTTLLTGDLAKAEPHCATGCYPSPPGSPAGNANSSSGRRDTGPGAPTSPPHSPAWPPCPPKASTDLTHATPTTHNQHRQEQPAQASRQTQPAPNPSTTNKPARSNDLRSY